MRHLDTVFSSTMSVDASCTPRHSRYVSQLTPFPFVLFSLRHFEVDLFHLGFPIYKMDLIF